MSSTFPMLLACLIFLLSTFLPLLTSANASEIFFISHVQEEKTENNFEENPDKILGPDVNFPFRPENHKNNSRAVSRLETKLDEL